MKNYLDFQKDLKSKEQFRVKEQDRQMAKFSLKREEEDEVKRNDYFDKLK